MSITTTTYDHARLEELTRERQQLLGKAKTIVEAARSAGRELSAAEEATVQAASAKIETELDPELKAQKSAAVKAVMGLADASYNPEMPDGPFDARATEGFLTAIKSKTSYRVEVPRSSMHTKAALTGAIVRPPAGEGRSPGGCTRTLVRCR